jgi:biopolymer transport protein ExbD
MITPASSESSEPDHGFQIAPMVDVVFVLLLFFMALAGMQQIEKYMKADLPGRTGVEGRDLPLVIDIAADGKVQCNGLELLNSNDADSAKLLAWLKPIASQDPETPVTIRPANQTEHGKFVQVLAALQQVGLKKIRFN